MDALRRILDLKEKMNLSDADFEKKLHLKPKPLDSWKRGNSQNYLKIIVDISSFFNVSTDYLLKGEPQDQQTTTGNIHNSGAMGIHNHAPVTISNGIERELSKQEQDLLRIYNAVDGKKQMEIMKFVYDAE